MWLSRLFEPRPFNQGYLPEDEGHKVFFMEFGNPKGKPIVVLHGGPGGCCKPQQAAFADLRRYRVIMFDQRGCKRSQPLGEMKNNTTQALLNDINRLLNYLKINENIILRGGSWGSTLALLYAEKYPNRVDKLLLSQIFLADKAALSWEDDGAGLFYPEFLEEMRRVSKRRDGLACYYADLINSDDAAQQLAAANTYGWWERVRSSLSPKWNTLTALSEEELASQKVYINYAAQNFMLKDGEILDNLHKIAGIPTVIVHNRLDFVCPLRGAYLVHKGLPQSRLVVVPDSGHVSELLHKVLKKELKKELA